MKSENTDTNGATTTKTTSSGMGMGRRRFLTATAGAGTVAAVGTTPQFSPISRARALAPVALGAGYAVGIAASYAARRVDTFLTGDDFDDSEFDGLQEAETLALVRESLLDMHANDDSAMTNLQNVLDTAENAAYSDAQAAAVEQMDLGNTEADTISAAEDAITEFYVTQQQNFLDHAQIQVAKMTRLFSRLESFSGVGSYLSIYAHENGGGNYGDYDEPSISGYNGPVSHDMSLLDGSSYSLTDVPSWGDSGTSGPHKVGPFGPTSRGQSSIFELYISPADGGSESLFWERYIWTTIWNTIESQHSQVTTDVSEWISTVYPKFEAGDIDTSDLVTSSQFSTSASEETGYAFSTADLALMGIPISEGTILISLPDANDGEGTTVEGALAARSPPDGGFEVGTEYDPANVSGPVWMAYNYEEEGEMKSDLVNLEQPFVITEAESADGEALDSVTFRSRNQRTLETDIAALNEELTQLKDYQTEMQEKQKEAAAGGSGGGGSGLDNPVVLLVLGAGAALFAALGFGN